MKVTTAVNLKKVTDPVRNASFLSDMSVTQQFTGHCVSKIITNRSILYIVPQSQINIKSRNQCNEFSEQNSHYWLSDANIALPSLKLTSMDLYPKDYFWPLHLNLDHNDINYTDNRFIMQTTDLSYRQQIYHSVRLKATNIQICIPRQELPRCKVPVLHFFPQRKGFKNLQKLI